MGTKDSDRVDSAEDRTVKSKDDTPPKKAPLNSRPKPGPEGRQDSIPPPIPPASNGLVKTSGADSNYRKVAKFLVLVGKDEAARILSKLDPSQVEKVSREIASISRVDEGEAAAILAEFKELLSSSGTGRGGPLSGGVDAARDVLRAAFGKEKGDAFLKRAVPESAENPFGFLEDFQGDQIALLFKDESSATTALVISRLSPKAAAATLSAMDPLKRLETVKRVAHLGKTDSDILERVAAALRDKVRSIGRADSESVDGRAALAAILKQADAGLGDRLLEELETVDPELSQDLKERLYTLDDVVKADDRSIQERLRTMEDREVALLLKGRNQSFAMKILSNLSSTRRALVQEEGSILGAVPKKDVDSVARDFLAWFRRGREEGRILLVDDEDVMV